MARTMEKIIPVKITTDALNCYATLQRAMITATTACLRLNDKKSAEICKKMKNYASEKYDELFDQYSKEHK